MKQLIILVGPKGSGKTYIGSLAEAKLGIKFFRVEDVWLKVKAERLSEEYIKEGFNLVESEIDKILHEYKQVIIESTGTTKYFKTLLESLRSKYDLKLVKIEALSETCIQRVKSRDASVHIPVSDDKLKQINQEAVKVDIEFDAVINNESSSDREIIDKLKEMIK